MMPGAHLGRAPVAGLLGAASFLLVGWTAVMVPTLIRSIETTFRQDDAGMGLYYFVFAAMYALGSLVGGLSTERLGRRVVLTSSATLLAFGVLALALAPSWTTFVLAALPAGLGVGSLDGGGNGLFLDLFTAGSGRAMNLLHLSFSVGALSAPLVIGRLVDAGAAWQAILVGTAFVAAAFAIAFVVIPMPSGRHVRATGVIDPEADRPVPPIPPGTTRSRLASGSFAIPIILLAIAISAGVAAESGVSSWLVRFLDPAPLSVATTGLTLFYVGLALGRLVSARLADRFDHRRFAIGAAIGCAIAVTGAVLVPWQPVAILCFAASGFAVGPIFPMVMVLAGERYPGRSAAISGSLASAGLVGAVVYPPIMGLLSVSVGLAIAMAGNAVLAASSALALILLGRTARAARTR